MRRRLHLSRPCRMGHNFIETLLAGSHYSSFSGAGGNLTSEALNDSTHSLRRSANMKLENILPKMSKLYLNRVVSSFLKDVRIEDEDEMRAIVLRNASEFQNAERIKRSL